MRGFKHLIIGMLMIIPIVSKAEQKEKRRLSNWYIMSGYGYSGVLGDMKGEGYSNVNTFLWQPNASWGFGLDYGMNCHNPVDYSYHKTMVFHHSRRHINYFLGPSVYWFPLNSERHRIHIGGSVNYFYVNDFDVCRHFDKETQKFVPEKGYYLESVDWGVGLGASVGYSYKIGEHVELGARFYTSWSQEEFHLMGLLNLAFHFNNNNPRPNGRGLLYNGCF